MAAAAGCASGLLLGSFEAVWSGLLPVGVDGGISFGGCWEGQGRRQGFGGLWEQRSVAALCAAIGRGQRCCQRARVGGW